MLQIMTLLPSIFCLFVYFLVGLHLLKTMIIIFLIKIIWINAHYICFCILSGKTKLISYTNIQYMKHLLEIKTEVIKKDK